MVASAGHEWEGRSLRELWDRWWATLDQRLFNEVLWPVLYKRLLPYVRRLWPDVGEDLDVVVQETILAAVKAKYRSPERVHGLGWLLRIARNQARDALRRRSRDKTIVAVGELPEWQNGKNSGSAEWENGGTMEFDAAVSCLARMVLDFQTRKTLRPVASIWLACCTLQVGRTLPHQDMARLLCCPPVTARKRVSDARKALNEYVQDAMVAVRGA